MIMTPCSDLPLCQTEKKYHLIKIIVKNNLEKGKIKSICSANTFIYASKVLLPDIFFPSIFYLNKKNKVFLLAYIEIFQEL